MVRCRGGLGTWRSLCTQENLFFTRTPELHLSTPMETCLSITLFLKSRPYIPTRWGHDDVLSSFVVFMPLMRWEVDEIWHGKQVLTSFYTNYWHGIASNPPPISLYAQGGIEGGTHIKIEGNSFDGYHGATSVSSKSMTLINDNIWCQVTVGGQPCNIETLDNSELTCSTPAQSEVVASDLGARGLR